MLGHSRSGPSITVSGSHGITPIELETARRTVERHLVLSSAHVSSSEVSISTTPGTRRVRAAATVVTERGSVSGTSVAPTTHDAVAQAMCQVRRDLHRLPRPRRHRHSADRTQA